MKSGLSPKPPEMDLIHFIFTSLNLWNRDYIIQLNNEIGHVQGSLWSGNYKKKKKKKLCTIEHNISNLIFNWAYVPG